VGQIYLLTQVDQDGHIDFMRHCAATVIGKQWVLTAAHCVTRTDPQTIFEPKTLKFTLDDGLHQVTVEKVFTYNPMGWDLDYDVALLKLTEPLNVKPVAIPNKPEDFPDIKASRPVIAISDGASDIEWEKHEDQRACPLYGAPCYFFYLGGDESLRKGPGMTLSDAEAKLKIRESILYGDNISVDYNPSTMLSVYSPSGQHVLPGDSGGALLTQTKAGYVQVGVTSWGPRLEGDGFAKEYKEDQKQGVVEHLKLQPTFFANLLDRNILHFIHHTIKNN
jgi:hypothetical protein